MKLESNNEKAPLNHFRLFNQLVIHYLHLFPKYFLTYCSLENKDIILLHLIAHRHQDLLLEIFI